MGSLAALAPALITAIGDVGASLFAPTPYQEMHPYNGVNAAEQTMGNAGASMKDVLLGLLKKNSEDVTLPDATVQPVDSVGGFSLTDPGGLSKAPSLAGLKFPSLHPVTGVPDFTGQYGADIHGAGVAPPADVQMPDTGEGRTTSTFSAPVRNKFAASNFPSAVQGDVPSDPTQAALHLLRTAAAAA